MTNSIAEHVVPLLGAVTLNGALGTALGIIQAILLVVCFCCLGGAVVQGLTEKSLANVKTVLTIALLAALGWVITQTLFKAGGNTGANIVAQEIN